ncbi:MAG: hypothetical protein MUF34_30775 [Polyangiaceae bacterium]|jgi:hypothetical protein|nr:hypothetical protein [Polyangiaceae bacterium]
MTNRIDEIKAKWSKLRAMRPLVGTLSTEETDALVAEVDRLKRERDEAKAIAEKAILSLGIAATRYSLLMHQQSEVIDRQQQLIERSQVELEKSMAQTVQALEIGKVDAAVRDADSLLGRGDVSGALETLAAILESK